MGFGSFERFSVFHTLIFTFRAGVDGYQSERGAESGDDIRGCGAARSAAHGDCTGTFSMEGGAVSSSRHPS